MTPAGPDRDLDARRAVDGAGPVRNRKRPVDAVVNTDRVGGRNGAAWVDQKTGATAADRPVGSGEGRQGRRHTGHGSSLGRR